jgi:hypothetical protein
MRFLIDHNLTGESALLWSAIAATGWVELLQIQFVSFAEVELQVDSDDRTVWRFAQINNIILLTANRNMKGEDSLEQVIREENTLQSLPIVTISDRDHMLEVDYRRRCAERLIEILIDLDLYRGARRVYIP